MKAKKKWYDYLWIFSLTYLVLGFVNILFAWLGMICFIVPLVISIGWGNKTYCNKFCGRGQLFSILGGHFGLSRKKDMPKWMKSKYFRYGFLIFFFTMFFIMLWNTYLVFGFYSIMLTSTILGFVTMILFKPRSWCVYCPMGTMTQLRCKAKNVTKSQTITE